MVEVITRGRDEIGGLPVVADLPVSTPLVDALALPAVGFGRAQISKDEAKELSARMDTDELFVLPTGEVYPPQVFLRRKLNATFGPGGWGVRPCAQPMLQGRTIVQPWLLMVRDQPVSVAYGEADYQADNARMTYATAIEACKSNALMRCCKDLGIASECWDKRFAYKFLQEKCILVHVWVWNRREQQHTEDQWWRRTDDPPFPQERKPEGRGRPTQTVGRGQSSGAAQSSAAQAAGGGDRVITPNQLKRLMAILNNAKVEPAALHKYLGDKYPTTFDDKKGRCTAARLTMSAYETVCAWAERGGQEPVRELRYET